MTLPAETRLDRVRAAFGAEYEIVRLLGEGGMASVYLARERALKRLVAIKVLDPDLGVSPGFRARFQREAELAAGLQHPHIVPIYRVGEADGLSYFTMAYIEGESLADRLKAEGRLPIAEAVRIGRETAAALAAAHRRGIIHRDVKPQNLLVDQSGFLKVMDFGIARLAEHPSEPGRALTAAGVVVGTPQYMAPEQLFGDAVDGRADLYAAGAVLFECVTGRPVFEAPSLVALLARHLEDAPPDPRQLNPDIPESLAAVILRALARKPADRWPTASQFLHALEQV